MIRSSTSLGQQAFALTLAALCMGSCAPPKGGAPNSSASAPYAHAGLDYEIPAELVPESLSDRSVRIRRVSEPADRIEHFEPATVDGPTSAESFIEQGSKETFRKFAKEQGVPGGLRPAWRPFGRNRYYSVHCQRGNREVWIGYFLVENKAFMLGMWLPAADNAKASSNVRDKFFSVLESIRPSKR
jgi:hypothetical protein